MVRNGMLKRAELFFLPKLNKVVRKQDIVISEGKNQYIFSKKRKILDFSLSSGAMMLGHGNNVFVKSLKSQLVKGSNYSSENYNQIKYKDLLKKTFNEFNSFYFSNSGSEANIRALRIARAITQKTKFAMVSGSWHGSVDSFMFEFNNEIFLKQQIKSLSSGIDHLKKNVVMLPYNDIKNSKKILDKNYKNLALLIIEPIQCAVPSEYSVNYIKFLEDYCHKKKIILCFDEIITGLRVKNLAVFKKYKLKPDIATFAKCFGGGLPIGITCFSKEIDKKISRLNKKIFFGGTFSGNPVSTKVGLETFIQIKKNSKKINDHINKLSEKLEKEINEFCVYNKIKFKLQRFESIIRPVFSNKTFTDKFSRNKEDKNFSNSLKLKKFLSQNNIFISSNCCFFISYCHNEKNIENLILVLKKYLKKLSK